MTYHFFSRTNVPTNIVLEPSLEEVFHQPERYRKHFKPLLRLEANELRTDLDGPLFFLYTTKVSNGDYLTFRLREGKYELVDLSDDGVYEVIEDLEAHMENLGSDYDDDDDEGELADLPLTIDNRNQYTGQWLQLHSMESDADFMDDEFTDGCEAIRLGLQAQGIEMSTEDGHFGGKPCWLQGYWSDIEEMNDSFIGQVMPCRLGKSLEWQMAYLFAKKRNGETIVEMMWETT